MRGKEQRATIRRAQYSCEQTSDTNSNQGTLCVILCVRTHCIISISLAAAAAAVAAADAVATVRPTDRTSDRLVVTSCFVCARARSLTAISHCSILFWCRQFCFFLLSVFARTCIDGFGLAEQRHKRHQFTQSEQERMRCAHKVRYTRDMPRTDTRTVGHEKNRQINNNEKQKRWNIWKDETDANRLFLLCLHSFACACDGSCFMLHGQMRMKIRLKLRNCECAQKRKEEKERSH